MYSCTLRLISALDGVGGQSHAPTALPPGKDTVILVEKVGLAQGPVWKVEENFAQTGIRSPYSPGQNELSRPQKMHINLREM